MCDVGSTAVRYNSENYNWKQMPTYDSHTHTRHETVLRRYNNLPLCLGGAVLVRTTTATRGPLDENALNSFGNARGARPGLAFSPARASSGAWRAEHELQRALATRTVSSSRGMSTVRL